MTTEVQKEGEGQPEAQPSGSPQQKTDEGAAKPGGILSAVAGGKPAEKGSEKAAEKKTEEPKWFWADGVPGTGEPPEWLKGEKYKTAEEQAKAFVALEKKLGAVPEKYELRLPKDIVDAGGVIDESSPLVKDFMEFAKGARLPQEKVDQLLEIYARAQMADANQDLADLIEELGEGGRRVAAQINAWAISSLEPEQQAWLDGALRTAEDVYTFSSILQRLGGSGTRESQSSAGKFSSEVDRLNAEIAEAMKDPRYTTDPTFEKGVRAKFARLVELEGGAV